MDVFAAISKQALYGSLLCLVPGGQTCLNRNCDEIILSRSWQSCQQKPL